jgi:multidrug efflux pump subunit AcrA (membrane-fusion protein)
VERGDFVRRVRADGNLEAVDATILGPPAEVTRGLKIAWLAQDGALVKAGEVVIRFDSTELEEELRDGEFDRATVETKIEGKLFREEGHQRNLDRDVELAEVELDYARTFQSKDEQIFSRNEIIEAEIDQDLALRRKDHASESGRIQQALGQTELDLLTIKRRKAEIKIDQAVSGLAALEVRAPHDGIFVLKRQWGRKPEIGQMVWRGMAVAELPKLDRMQAKVYVLEADAGGLESGVPAVVILDSQPDMVYPARVEQADALAQRRSRRSPVQYFGVVLALDRTDPVMKPGQRIEAVLTFDERKGVLSIPPQAIFEKDDEKFVYVREAGGFEPKTIEIGPIGLGRVVVESGLREGDLVALRDPTRAPDAAGSPSAVGPLGR